MARNSLRPETLDHLRASQLGWDINRTVVVDSEPSKWNRATRRFMKAMERKAQDVYATLAASEADSSWEK